MNLGISAILIQLVIALVIIPLVNRGVDLLFGV